MGCLLQLLQGWTNGSAIHLKKRQYLKDTAHLGGKCLSITGTQARSECWPPGKYRHSYMCVHVTHTHMPLCMFLCKDLVAHPCSNLYMCGYIPVTRRDFGGKPIGARFLT